MQALPGVGGVTVLEETMDERTYSVHLLLRFLAIPAKRLHGLGSVGEALAPAGGRERGSLVLADGPLVLNERSAILAYLARRYDWRDSWLPADDPILFGQAMQWLGRMEQARQTARGHDRHAAGTSLRTHLNAHLLEQEAKGLGWFVGRTPTIADVAVFAHLAFAGFVRPDADALPALQRWAERFCAVPGFTPIGTLVEEEIRPIRLPVKAPSPRPAETGESTGMSAEPQQPQPALAKGASRTWMRVERKPPA